MGEVELTRRVARLHRLEGLAGLHLAATSRASRRSGVVDRSGAASTTDWLTATTGRSGRDAARLARLGTNLADLPGTAKAPADGDLTIEGADVVVQTADGAALWRDERRQRGARRVSLVPGGDGMWDLGGRLSGEVGTKFATALNALDHPDGPDSPAETRRTPAQRRADALERLVDVMLDRGLVDGTGGIARPHLSVHVDADTLRHDLTATNPATGSHGADGAVAPDDPAWDGLPAGTTDWGDVVSPQAIRRLLCDAAVSRIVLAGRSQVLDVGRTTRSWSGPQRRAVNARDRGCRGPGCTRPIAWTQVHHLHWWRNNGVTSVANGLALCHHCHRLVHDHHWTVHLDVPTAAATWTTPDGHTTTTRPHHPQPDGDPPTCSDPPRGGDRVEDSWAGEPATSPDHLKRQPNLPVAPP